jgi:hypothetical protein
MNKIVLAIVIMSSFHAIGMQQDGKSSRDLIKSTKQVPSRHQSEQEPLNKTVSLIATNRKKTLLHDQKLSIAHEQYLDAAEYYAAVLSASLEKKSKEG